MARAEAFASKYGPAASAMDALGLGSGFGIALFLLGSIREVLGAGSWFGIPLLPSSVHFLVMILPPGAFITLGLMIAFSNRYITKKTA
jgi:electron transport complex protein RnfE